MLKGVAVAMFLLLTLAGCGGDDLVGLWIDVDYPGNQMELFDDGTGTTRQGIAPGVVLDFTWEVDGEELCVTYDDGSGSCDRYELDGDRLALELPAGLGMARMERWTD